MGDEEQSMGDEKKNRNQSTLTVREVSLYGWPQV